MPRTLPAGTETWLAKPGALFEPIILLDIQTLDGAQYFWSDYEGSYPARIITGNPTTFYNGWIKSGCSFTTTRDLSSNTGELLLQNLSGNTIDRDVSAALKNHEFEGALAVTRIWVPLLDVAIKEFHCYLTEQNPKEDEFDARESQLLDPTQYFLADDIEGTDCTWRFKSARCGSTGSATSCPKNLPACQDPTRNAQERFNGIITTIANTVNIPTVNLGGGGGGGSDPNSGLGGGARKNFF